MTVIHRRGRWGAKIYRDNRQVWLGTFRTRDEACAAEAHALAERDAAKARSVPLPPVDLRIYFIQEGASGPIKIGVSRPGGVEHRLKDLQCGNPTRLYLRCVIRAGRGDELKTHRRFQSARIRGEWFEPVPELLKYIRDYRPPPNASP